MGLPAGLCSFSIRTGALILSLSHIVTCLLAQLCYGLRALRSGATTNLFPLQIMLRSHLKNSIRSHVSNPWMSYGMATIPLGPIGEWAMKERPETNLFISRQVLRKVLIPLHFFPL